MGCFGLDCIYCCCRLSNPLPRPLDLSEHLASPIATSVLDSNTWKWKWSIFKHFIKCPSSRLPDAAAKHRIQCIDTLAFTALLRCCWWNHGLHPYWTCPAINLGACYKMWNYDAFCSAGGTKMVNRLLLRLIFSISIRCILVLVALNRRCLIEGRNESFFSAIKWWRPWQTTVP